jgi:hypothetical protein
LPVSHASKNSLAVFLIEAIVLLLAKNVSSVNNLYEPAQRWQVVE